MSIASRCLQAATMATNALFHIDGARDSMGRACLKTTKNIMRKTLLYSSSGETYVCSIKKVKILQELRDNGFVCMQIPHSTIYEIRC